MGGKWEENVTFNNDRRVSDSRRPPPQKKIWHVSRDG